LAGTGRVGGVREGEAGKCAASIAAGGKGGMKNKAFFVISPSKGGGAFY